MEYSGPENYGSLIHGTHGYKYGDINMYILPGLMGTIMCKHQHIPQAGHGCMTIPWAVTEQTNLSKNMLWENENRLSTNLALPLTSLTLLGTLFLYTRAPDFTILGAIQAVLKSYFRRIFPVCVA